MELKLVKTKADKKSFINFIYEIYKDDAGYNDMNITFVRNFLYRQDGFVKRNEVIPVQVVDGTKIMAECIYVIDETEEIKLSFLEFRADAKQAIIKLRDYSYELMDKVSKCKTIIGVNGQISYGLGILNHSYNTDFEFNSNYNRDYYTKVLDEVFEIRKRAFAYEYSTKHTLKMIEDEMGDCLNEEIEFRHFDMKHFKKDMMLMGELCHESLKSTPYYSKKTAYEMYELMKQVKFIMKPDDILFAMKNGKEIGFIYSHPDYAELFDRPKLNYVKFYLRYLLKKPKIAIFNVIGVLPEYQKSGVAVSLIYKSVKDRGYRYEHGVSSFILEENIPSTYLCKKISTGIHKEFYLYELTRGNDV